MLIIIKIKNTRRMSVPSEEDTGYEIPSQSFSLSRGPVIARPNHTPTSVVRVIGTLAGMLFVCMVISALSIFLHWHRRCIQNPLIVAASLAINIALVVRTSKMEPGAVISAGIWLLITLTRIPPLLYLAFWYYPQQLTMTLVVLICSLIGHIISIHLHSTSSDFSHNLTAVLYSQVVAIIGFYLVHNAPLEFGWLSSALAMAIVLLVNFYIAINASRLLHSAHYHNQVVGLCKLQTKLPLFVWRALKIWVHNLLAL